MAINNCEQFIYSSSATVYGDAVAPVNENSITGQGLSCNYAKNKYDIEQYLINNTKMKIIILRYFNPIGAHPSGLIGENPNGLPNNIFPYLLRVAKWTNIENDKELKTNSYEKFTVFGNDYMTRDGTCIRDYVHVQDLAQAHIDVLSIFEKNNNPFTKIYNVGTGKGTTVTELITTFNKILIERNKKPIKIHYGDRRIGDLDISYSNVNKIYDEVGFRTKYDIETMCIDGLNFIGL